MNGEDYHLAQSPLKTRQSNQMCVCMCVCLSAAVFVCVQCLQIKLSVNKITKTCVILWQRARGF